MHALLLAVAVAATPAPDPAIKFYPMKDQLWQVRTQIDQIHALQKQGLPLDQDGTVVSDLVLKANSLTQGYVNSYDDLVRLTDLWAPSTSLWDKTKGLLTLVNIISVTGAIFIVSALVWLFRLYFISLIFAIPAKVWNVILWIICVGLTFLGTEVSPDNYLFLVMPGALGMACCWWFTCYLYFENTGSYGFFFGVIAAMWAVVAQVFGSQVIGFMTIMALLSSLGFICGMIPGVVWIGFENDKVVSRATFSAGFLLALHVVLTILGDTSLAPFRPGMNFMGCFVFYLGLLIISSKWYDYDYGEAKEGNWWALYWSKNAFTVVMGLAALYLGTVYQMHTLLGVGGTFFYLYILEKYYEVPWQGKGWAWSLLGLGLMLYAFAWFAKGHPDYFIFMGTGT